MALLVSPSAPRRERCVLCPSPLRVVGLHRLIRKWGRRKVKVGTTRVFDSRNGRTAIVQKRMVNEGRARVTTK